jgi:hypothetical protein
MVPNESIGRNSCTCGTWTMRAESASARAALAGRTQQVATLLAEHHREERPSRLAEAKGHGHDVTPSGRRRASRLHANDVVRADVGRERVDRSRNRQGHTGLVDDRAHQAGTS